MEGEICYSTRTLLFKNEVTGLPRLYNYIQGFPFKLRCLLTLSLTDTHTHIYTHSLIHLLIINPRTKIKVSSEHDQPLLYLEID